MAASQARIDANRRNALKSTGPKTTEGKERSRRNALKHGLTAEVIIREGDAAAVARRVEHFVAELAPEQDTVLAVLAQRVAILSVRVQRCQEHEDAMTTERQRTSQRRWDAERLDYADYLFDHIREAPAARARELMGFPEGVDLMLAKLADLREFTTPLHSRGTWDFDHGHIFELVCGRRLGDKPDSDCTSLTQAIALKRYDELVPDLAASLAATKAANAAADPFEWALGALRAMVDAKVAELRAHRETLDLPGVARSRAEAPTRALIGSDAEAILARKYEAAAERSMLRILGQIERIQDRRLQQGDLTARAAEVIEQNAQDLPEMAELDRDLGSFLPPANPPAVTIDVSPSAPAQPSNRRARRAALAKKRR